MRISKLGVIIALTLLSHTAFGGDLCTPQELANRLKLSLIPEDNGRSTFNSVEEYYQYLFGKGGFTRDKSFEENVRAAVGSQTPAPPVPETGGGFFSKFVGSKPKAPKPGNKTSIIEKWILAEKPELSREAKTEAAVSIQKENLTQPHRYGGDILQAPKFDDEYKHSNEKKITLEFNNGRPKIKYEIGQKFRYDTSKEWLDVTDIDATDSGITLHDGSSSEDIPIHDQKYRLALYKLSAAENFGAISRAEAEDVKTAIGKWISEDLANIASFSKIDPLKANNKPLRNWDWSFKKYASPDESLIYLPEPSGESAESETYGLAIRLRNGLFIKLDHGEIIADKSPSYVNDAPGPFDKQLIEERLKESLNSLGITRDIDPAQDFPKIVEDSPENIQRNPD
jgi:hypothetical protein